MIEEMARVVSADIGRTIVQLPHRKGPSICIQGDTALTLAQIAHDNAKLWMAKRHIDDLPDEMLDEMVYLSNVLVSMVLGYNEVSDRVGHEQIRPLQSQGLNLLDIELDGDV